MHIDEWIEDVSFIKEDESLGDTDYARWMLMYFRLPALMQMKFKRFMGEYKLFFTHKGKRYRCTGASRMGDVYGTTNFEQSTGYTDRGIEPEECTNWSENP